MTSSSLASQVWPAWLCEGCGQKNAGWTRECGRCGEAWAVPRPDDVPLDLAGDPVIDTAPYLPRETSS